MKDRQPFRQRLSPDLEVIRWPDGGKGDREHFQHVQAGIEEEDTMNQLVLVIDDSLVIRKVLETSLRRAGYEVKSFADGVEALRWFTTPHVCIPALVLVDLGLPKLDGYEVIHRFKAIPGCEQTRFMIVSRCDGVIDRLKGRLVGACAYLTKPFKTQEVLAAVQTHLGVPVGRTAVVCAPTIPRRAYGARRPESSMCQSTSITKQGGV